MDWEPVIGLELHVQLATRSKIFSGAANRFGAAANTQACAVDLGLPGVLPVPNAEAIRMAVKFGLAIDAAIARRSVFARKNYFYPDLPKGYQVSQYEAPIVSGGRVRIQLEDGAQEVRITPAHLEEDAGKSVHDGFPGAAAIDLNRAGAPLIEVVSEPDLRSAAAAVAYMKHVHALVRYLEISDANMQEGSFRCDANVSVRPVGATALGTRAEIKNINSFRFVEQAVNYEIQRQIGVLEAGGEVVQETRLFDAERVETRSMRAKEDANDYRYFPDPDLPPIEISEEFIDSARAQLPELPERKRRRFMADYDLSERHGDYLAANRHTADYFEAAVAAGGDARLVANWIMGELGAALNRDNLDIDAARVDARALAGLMKRIADNSISNKLAREVFAAMWQGEGDADAIIDKRGLRQLSDSAALDELVAEVIAESGAQLAQYLAAPPDKQRKLLGYFVGQVMKKSQGRANPQQVNQLLAQRLREAGAASS